MLMQNLAKLVITLLEKPFQKWGLDFIRPTKLVSRPSRNWYISVATNYATKWVEAQMFYTNIIVMTTKFLYKHILTRFGCPSTIINNQGTHFVNDVIIYITHHFILKHVLVLLFIIHKETIKLSLLKRFLEPY